MPVPANASFAMRSASFDLFENEVRAHGLQLDRHLSASSRRHNSLELVTPFASKREDEEFLRDGVGIAGHNVRFSAAVVQPRLMRFA